MVKKSRPSYKNISIALYLVALAALLSGLYFLSVPKNQTNTDIFWDAIAQNLKTSSVTKSISQTNENIKIEEKTDLQFRKQLLARKTTIVNRQSESAQSSVTTESIGTIDADYIRYTKLFSSYHGGLENQLNKWADDKKQDAKAPEHLKDALLSTPLIFGYLSKSQQATLLAQLKDLNVYTVTNDSVQKVKTSQGIVAYDIPVTVNWNEFTDVYKLYLGMIGLSDVAQSIGAPAEPTAYDFIMSINPSSKHIISLRLFESYGVVQEYNNYDQSLSIEVPAKTELTGAELEALVKEQVR